jgi:hypothetical protein
LTKNSWKVKTILRKNGETTKSTKIHEKRRFLTTDDQDRHGYGEEKAEPGDWKPER